MADPELVLIINITENKFCNDCQKKNPRWCSINNAVLLCPSCARKHQKYNKNISKVKSLEGELWTKDEIKKLYIGGNERFNKMMTSYNIPLTNENAEYKYHTKIAGYYRSLLNEELKGKKVIDLVRPSLKEGIELISKEDYDKLNQYVPSQDNVLENNNNLNNNSDNNSSDVLNIPGNDNIYANPFASDFTSNNNNNNYSNNRRNYNNINNNSNNRNNNNNYQDFEKHLNNFAEGVNNVFNNLSQKAQNIDYNEKLKNAEEFIMDKKEKIENSETFKGFMSALSTGIDTLVKKTENFFNDSIDNYAKSDMPQQRRYNNRNQNQMQFQGQRINNNNNNMNNNNSFNMNNNNNFNMSNNNNFNMSNNNNNFNNGVQSQNNSNNNNNSDVNNLDIETPEGDGIPQLVGYSNDDQNINITGEHKNNENNVENLDGNNNEHP